MKKRGFTLAEMLITLAIIGVVSALVIPSVLKNYNDKKYNTARLKALKTFGEAGKMASINDEMTGQETARAFAENVLSKYLKITKICNNNKASECNFPEKIQPSNPASSKLGSNGILKWNQIGGIATENTWTDASNSNLSVYIMTADEFSAKIFYNPNCARHSKEIGWTNCNSKECNTSAVDQACLNVIYDMNGVKGPNHVGEDIGIVTTFWSGINAISVAPGIPPYNIAKSIYDEGSKTQSDAQIICAERGNYTLANVYELQSIALNIYLTSMPMTGAYFWTGSYSKSSPNGIWVIYSNLARRFIVGNSAGLTSPVWCIRR